MNYIICQMFEISSKVEALIVQTNRIYSSLIMSLWTRIIIFEKQLINKNISLPLECFGVRKKEPCL